MTAPSERQHQLPNARQVAALWDDHHGHVQPPILRLRSVRRPPGGRFPVSHVSCRGTLMRPGFTRVDDCDVNGGTVRTGDGEEQHAHQQRDNRPPAQHVVRLFAPGMIF